MISVKEYGIEKFIDRYGDVVTKHPYWSEENCVFEEDDYGILFSNIDRLRIIPINDKFNYNIISSSVKEIHKEFSEPINILINDKMDEDDINTLIEIGFIDKPKTNYYIKEKIEPTISKFKSLIGL